MRPQAASTTNTQRERTVFLIQALIENGSIQGLFKEMKTLKIDQLGMVAV